MNTASLKKQMKNLSQSKIVLYILLILAVTNLFGYLMSENFTAVFMFLVIGYLTTYFTDNMIIVFAVSIFATNFAVAMNYNRNREGMTTEKKDNNEEKDEKTETVKKEDDSNVKTLTDRKGSYKILEYNALTGKKEKPKNSTTDNAMNDALKDNKTPQNPVIIDKKKEKGEVDGVCSGPSCKQNSKTTQIENAHAIVDNLLHNPDELIKQQQAIEQTIATLEPMIDKVEGMMNKIGGSKIASLIGGLTPLLGQTTPR
tara:strand:+ start:8326 stop:9096 length:771 start_codon:yes stop_codon:yes gene_type:complete